MTHIEPAAQIKELLLKTRVETAPETFFLVSLRRDAWLELLENPELSPRMSAPFMIFFDKREVTLLLDDVDFGTIRHRLRDARNEGNFRLLSFDTVVDNGVVGFPAEITRILAAAQIPVVALSSFSRDHLLIKQNDLAKALRVLGEHVGELC